MGITTNAAAPALAVASRLWSCWWDGSRRTSSWGHGCGDSRLQGKVSPLIHQKCREPGQTWVCHTTAIQAQDSGVATGKATEERIWTSL